MVKEYAEKLLNLIKNDDGLDKKEVFTEPNLDVQKLVDIILGECRCSVTDKYGNYARFGSSTDIRVIRMLIQVFLSSEKEIPAEIVSMALTKEGVIGPLKKVKIEKKYNEEKDLYELEIEDIFPKEFYVSIFSENLILKEKFIKNVIKPYVKSIIFENEILMCRSTIGATINKFFEKLIKKQKSNEELTQELNTILNAEIKADEELTQNIAKYIFINIMNNRYFKEELINRTINATELQKIGKVANGFGALVDNMAYEVLQMLELRSFPYGEISSVKSTFYTTVAVLNAISTNFDNSSEEEVLSKIEKINRVYSHKNEVIYRTESVNSNKFGLTTEFSDIKDINSAIKNVCRMIKVLLDRKDELDMKSYLKEIARIHYRFVKIQPFETANGRTARAIVNMLLMSKGMIGIFRKNARSEYMDYINDANKIIKENEKLYLEGLASSPMICVELENKFLKKEFPVLIVKN